MAKIRIAFIGCGRISSKHFDALNALQEQFTVQALCDMQPERAQHARSFDCNRNAVIYHDIATMLAKEQGLQVAIIALPNGLHAQAGMQCAQKGLHLLIEKPLVVELADGQKLVNACHNYNVELFLIHQNRFNPPIQQLYQAISQGSFGRLYSIYANLFWTRPQSYYDDEATWHGTKKMDGGAFYTQASHYVDMLQWLAGGLPQRLSSQLRTLARNIQTEDCGTAFLEWGSSGQTSNIIATINMSLLTYPRNLEGSILVLGEKGCAKIGGTAMNKLEHWQMASPEGKTQSKNNLTQSKQSCSSYETDSVYGFGHKSLYQAIAAQLRGEKLATTMKAAIITGPNILDNSIILDAIQRSSQNKGSLIEL